MALSTMLLGVILKYQEDVDGVRATSRRHLSNGRTVSPSTRRNPFEDVPQEAWLAANLPDACPETCAAYAGTNVGSGQVMSLVEAVRRSTATAVTISTTLQRPP